MKFGVGQRVRVLVQDNSEHIVPGVLVPGVLVADAPVGAVGTIKETEHYPVYGVLIDGDKLLSGYFEDELEAES